MHNIQKVAYILLVAGGLSLFININSPFEKAWENDAVIYSLAARNYFKYPLHTTKLGMVVGPSGLSESEIKDFRYTNHPPLLSVTAALSLYIFGDNESSTRLVQILFAIGCTFLIYLIAKRMFGNFVALFSSVFCLLSPFMLWHGRIIEITTMAPLFFLLVVVYFYIRWREEGKTRLFVIMIIAQIIGCFFGWTAYFALPIVFIYDFLKYRRFTLLIPAITVPTACLTIYLFHIWIINGNTALKRLVGEISFESQGYNYNVYSEVIKNYFIYLPYLLGIIPSLLILYVLIKKFSFSKDTSFLITLFGLGIIWGLAFSKHCSFQSWSCVFPFIPFFAITASIAFEDIWNKGYKVVCVILLILFMSQSAYFLFAKYRQDNWYTLERNFDKVILSSVGKNERIATTIPSLDKEFVYYYTDCFVFWDVTSLEKLNEIMSSSKPPSYFITSTTQLASEKIFGKVGGIGENTAKGSGFLLPNDAFLSELKKRYHYEESDGFMIFSLSKY